MRTVTTGWDDFKTTVDAKNLLVQYLENTEREKYEIWAHDGSSVSYQTHIKILLPTPIGSDQEDFENNYQAAANDVIDKPSHVTSLVHGQTTVTTAGTAVLLIDATTEIQTLTIKALSGNEGDVYVGKSTVDSTNGFIMEPGSTLSIDHDNAKDNIYIDSDSDGDGVSYFGGAK